VRDKIHDAPSANSFTFYHILLKEFIGDGAFA